jgi:site-specific recombinase XerD
VVFLGEAIEAFLQYADGIKNLSPHSLKAYRNDLSFFLSSFPEKEKKILFEIDLVDLRSCVGLLSKQKKQLQQLTDLSVRYEAFFCMFIE